MNQYHQIKELFYSALDLVPEEREAFLAQACAADTALRAEVEALLVHHQQSEGFLETPPIPAITDVFDSTEEVPQGKHIGPYKILREIGHGGMGAVYLAVRDDAQYQKQVAIKLIRGSINSQFILNRFRQERQILAQLSHPNIIPLLDGGTTEEGWPYFVMEFVDGQPITEFCDTHNLSTIARLQLFRQVCAAVQYAHQNLIVHRDLKPGNVLVTAESIPKLLDFGIAKLLAQTEAQEENQTVTEMRMLTPDYASPEQIKNQPITTASDIYSLGVLLYELLSGDRPYRVKNLSPHEMARVICEQEPEPPSKKVGHGGQWSVIGGRWTEAANQETKIAGQATNERKGFSFLPTTSHRPPTTSLRGDLDNIVLMALRKEPERRYASVEQFSEDIRRYLDGLPVSARTATFGYRAAKFVKRNKVGVGAAALIALSLFVGMLATVWQARVAQSERARAERRFNDVRQLANSFLFEFHDGIEKLPGATPMRELVVKRALEYLDSLVREASNDAGLQNELAAAYERVGNIQSSFGWANKGDTAGALASYRKALTIREQLSAAQPKEAAAQIALAGALSKVGQTLIHTHDFASATDHLRRAQSLIEPLLSHVQLQTEARRQLRGILILLGQVLSEQEQIDQALSLWQQAERLAEEEIAQHSTDTQARRSLAIVLYEKGYLLLGTKDNTEAIRLLRRSLDLSRALATEAPQDLQARRDLALAHDQLGNALSEAGDVTGALANYSASLKLRESLAAADPSNAQARSDLATGYYNFGYALALRGDVTRGIATYQKAVELMEEVSAANPANARFRARVANFYLYYGKLWEGLATKASAASSAAGRERWMAARQWYQRALTVVDDMHAHNVATGSGAPAPERLTDHIKQCDAALAKLK